MRLVISALVLLSAIVGAAGCPCTSSCTKLKGGAGPHRFLRLQNFITSDEVKLQQILVLLQQVYGDEEFEKAVTEFSGWDHKADPSAFKKDDGKKVWDRFFAERSLDIRCYRPKYIASDATAHTTGDDRYQISLNGYALKSRPIEAWVGSIVHEISHLAGYKHKGNDENGNENTVPYKLGALAQERAEALLEADKSKKGKEGVIPAESGGRRVR